MTFIDYYQVLGLEKTANAREIKTAYRKLARKFHPDLNPKDIDAKRNFQLINEANEVLSEPEKRKKYDRYGKDWQHAESNKKPTNHQEDENHFRDQKYSRTEYHGEFSDFFESMFGDSDNAWNRKQVKFRGEDYSSQLNLSLIDASQTHKQTINVNGKSLRISIPAGIENGQTIRIAGHGGKGLNGGPNGDLYITFSIANHLTIKRLGNDLYRNVEIELYAAILGGEISVETLNGIVKLMVSPETQNGTRVKLKGKGFPVYKSDGQFGDFYLTYSVKIPSNLTEKQKRLFSELSKL